MYSAALMAESLALDLPDGVYADVEGWSGMIRHPDILAMTAGVYPVKPPSKWFDNPVLSGLTPLTIDDNGRVFGHIAAWHTSHIGLAGGVKPPKSKSGYAYYQTGVVKCDDGKLVNVGQITLTGGHAPLNAGVAKAVAHYDDTASAIMDVSAGEDKHGIWVAGSLRPEVSDAQLRSIRASSVSGDWRPISGKLELVAICAVNAPGFPIPRARMASGGPIALVAAGTEPLVEIAMNDRIESNVEQGIQAGLEFFRERILRLENVVLADGSVEEKPVDADQLRKRVRGGSALAASLRDRVRGPHTPETVSDVQSLAASLRERVKGSDAGPKAPAPEALTAARKPWNPLLHPRGADGRFIEVGSWVRWLRQGFGSTRRGQVKQIIPDPDSIRDGVPTRALAVVEFPDRDDTTVEHRVPFDELEKVAAPKGSVSEGDVDVDDDGEKDSEGSTALEKKIAAQTVGHLIHDDEHHVGDDDDGVGVPGTEDGNDTADQLDTSEAEDVAEAVEEAVGDVIDAVPDTPEEGLNPTDEQLQAEEITDLSEADADVDRSSADADASGGLVDGLIETPYVPPSDEWQKTSEWFADLQGETSEISDAIVNELHPDGFDNTTEWADAVRKARAQYESWRSAQLAQDPEADISLGAYLRFLEEKGLKAAALVAGLRERVRPGILARATDYWTDEKRMEAAAKGHALPDGTYPIDDVEDLRKAIDAYGRAKNPHTTKRHLIKRANILGSLGLLPQEWIARGFDPAQHMRGPDGRFIRTASSAPSAEQLGADSIAMHLRGRVHRTG